jgi:drug/metabolite transporter (DMT)-like permease
MIQNHLGEIAALTTAFCWTTSALAFESASKKAGSLPVNLIRLCLGFGFLSLFCLIYRGMLLPLDASTQNWFWLSLSGFVGFVFGDLLLFRAFVVIGSRVSMLIMALAPPMTALIGWFMMGEVLSLLDIIGMVLTIGGIALVVLDRNPNQNGVMISHPMQGILLAFGGAVGQAVGLVLSKYGMKGYNAFAASQIRLLAGMIGFSILFFPLGVWSRIGQAIRNRKAMAYTSLGSFFGPFLGVSFSLLAIQHTATGVASTIMAIVPVLIIPPSVIFLKERVNAKEIFGAVIAVTGVALLFF